MNSKIKLILFLAAMAVLNGIKGLNYSGAYIEGNIIHNVGLAVPEFIYGYLTLLALDMFPVILLEIVFGTYIYHHYFTASAYYFTRQADRKRWFLKEILRLAGDIFGMITVYVALSVISIMIIADRGFENVENILMCVSIIILFTMFTFLFSLLINIVSILMGSQYGFVCVYVLQAVFIMLLLLNDKLGSTEGIGRILFKLNPISNLIISWHSSGASYGEYINHFNMEFSIWYSVLYYGIGILMVIAAGILVADKPDITLENKEEQG